MVNHRPLSINQVYRRNGRAGGKALYMTDEGIAYKQMVFWSAYNAMMALHPTDRQLFQSAKEYEVILNLYFPTRQQDVDNCAKLVLDGMQQSIYCNDNRVTALHLYKHTDNANPRVEVAVMIDS